MMGLFGADAKKDPKEQVREWQRKMRQEQRQIDRQIANIQREEQVWDLQNVAEYFFCVQKAVRQIREASKKKDQMDVCRILAKEIVRTRRAVTKMYTTKAQINSVVMHMQHEVAVIRMAGSIKASTEVRVTPSSPGFTLTQVMRSMQQLVRVPEIAATMRELSKEMMRTGLIEEMMEETIEQMEPGTTFWNLAETNLHTFVQTNSTTPYRTK
jgi:charged multivesicular body protein 3